MTHTDINGRPTRRPPYRKPEFNPGDPTSSPRGGEYGAGQHPSSGRQTTGTRSGNPKNVGHGYGGTTDGRPVGAPYSGRRGAR